MKIVFMGTPDFSATVLEKLNEIYHVTAVVTSPDKPVGRGYRLQPSALKSKAEELNIPVLQYDRVSKEGIDDIRNIAPDIVVTAAFGQILSEEFLSIPKHGVLNVHASLLPKYRGSSPIQHAILNGDRETGITIMRTVNAVDAGDILLVKRTKIGEKETAGELFDRLAVLGGEAIIEAISSIENGSAEFVKQDDSLATHCSMITKADGKIDFHRTAREIDCFVRGMTPWPSAYTLHGNKTLKVFEVEKICEGTEAFSIAISTMSYSGNDKLNSGTVVMADTQNGLIVSAENGKSFVRLTQIQLEGAKRMSDVEFLRGRKIEIGMVLG